MREDGNGTKCQMSKHANMAEQNDRSQLPPGWECRYDVRSGRPYYINHFNKSTSWEDPRVRYWQYAQYTQAQNSVAPSPATSTTIPESIPMQNSGGGGGGGSYLVYAGAHRAPQVYPTPSPFRNPQPAFLSPGAQEFKTPLSSRSVSAMTNRLGDITIGSPTPVRNTETSLIQNVDTEVQVAKINAMFPTVSDTHIRLLLKKYLKNVFPKADETILLDILEQSDNNVQKASEKLIELGYEKRNPTGPSQSLLKQKSAEQRRIEQPTPTPPPRMRSIEEKNKMKGRLMEKYKSVPDKVIMLAMDSVDYDEERAMHILDIMVAEEATQTPRTSSGHSNRSDEQKGRPPVTEAIKLTASPVKKVKDTDVEKIKRPKNKNDVPKISRGTSTTEDKEYKSPYLTRPTGPNADLPKGANNEFLLPDYAPWTGPDATILTPEKRSVAVGPNRSLVTGSCIKGLGPNPDLRKGPMRGLAQGSIYSQRDVTNSESRGK
ncbi:uncharacterized protein LOC105688341 isoform X3 [Athalia rosae]|uniref:uncharacterized protein LOC105688341 isoform X3 n=1 Tax=Athalia rosae TaxID=37344 RepID=UPI002033F2ED|nr:uncharacterized protein LOC105688341 isoform X3 [Athalia rosae]